MTKQYKVAVIGCGMFANAQYLPNITKEANAVCVAVVDIVKERAEAAAAKYGVPEVYENVYELIEKCDFDIAIDAASIQAHHEINMAVLASGKHLISQKPAAPTVEMLTEQIELAKKMGVKFACVPVHPMRYDLAIAKDFLSHADQGAAEKWLNEENDTAWQSILRCDRGKRAEFAEPETVPAWIVGQIKYLLWIAMSDKKTTLLGLERGELLQKIAHHCRLLSGESVAFVTVGQNFCTVV